MPIETIKNRSYGIADKPTLDKLYNNLLSCNNSESGSLIRTFKSSSTLYAGDIVTIDKDNMGVRNIAYTTDPLYVLGVVTKTAAAGNIDILLEGSAIIEITPTIRKILDMKIFPNSRSSTIEQMVVSNFKHMKDIEIKPYCIYNSIYNDDKYCKLDIINPYTRDIYYIYNDAMNGGDK